MDFTKILEMVKQAAPLVTSLVGTPLLGLGVKAAEGILALGQKYKEINNLDDQDELSQRLNDLQAAVNAHADATIASLD